MFTNTEYQKLQHRLGYFFVQELEQITKAYNLGGDAMTHALNQFEKEWNQIQQLWEQLIARGTTHDTVICSKIVQVFQPYLLVRVSTQRMIYILEQTLALLPANTNVQARLSTLFLLGSAHQLMSDYEPMRQYYEQAAKLAQKQNAHWHLNEIDNKLAHYHLENLRYDEALKHAYRVLEEDSGSEDKQRASAALNIGNVYTNQQDFAPAETYLRQGLAYFEQTNDWNGAMHAHVNLGRLFAFMSHHKQAAYHYHRSLELNSSVLKNRRISATVFFNLAIITNRLGDYDETLFYAKHSIADYTVIGDQWGISRAMNTLGIAYLRQGHHLEADVIFRDVTKLRFDVGFTSGIIFVVANMVQNWNLAGEYEKAFAVLQDYLTQMIEIPSNPRPRFRLVGLALWTLAGLGVASTEVFQLLSFIRTATDSDWEISVFIEKIDAHLVDKTPISTAFSDITTEDALHILKKIITALNPEK